MQEATSVGFRDELRVVILGIHMGVGIGARFSCGDACTGMRVGRQDRKGGCAMYVRINICTQEGQEQDGCVSAGWCAGLPAGAGCSQGTDRHDLHL